MIFIHRIQLHLSKVCFAWAEFLCLMIFHLCFEFIMLSITFNMDIGLHLYTYNTCSLYDFDNGDVFVLAKDNRYLKRKCKMSENQDSFFVSSTDLQSISSFPCSIKSGIPVFSSRLLLCYPSSSWLLSCAPFSTKFTSISVSDFELMSCYDLQLCC